MPIYTLVPLEHERQMRGRARHLFSTYGLSLSLKKQTSAYETEIAEFPVEYLAKADLSELIVYLRQKYLIEVPQLLLEKVEWTESVGKLDISQDRNRAIHYRSRPVFVNATIVTFHLPVCGQAEIFDCAPNVFYVGEGAPRGYVTDGELRFEYTTENAHPPALKKEFETDLQRLHRVWRDVESELNSWNLTAQRNIAARLHDRVSRVERLQSEIGFPMRRRADAVPPVLIRKKLLAPRAPGDPHLALQQYEEILAVIQNFAITLERAPSAFANINEEDIRHRLLVDLNVVFEGNAGAEVFNVSGKTDILVKADGKTIFIAECKFWKGGASLSKAIDQLLSYTSWRDNKTALIILNRGRALSTVLRGIPQIVRKHRSYVRDEEYASETGFRYTLAHPDDSEREILLTVLVFEVPQPINP